ncbi:lymphotoxin-alpha-like isoform X2 [Corticium candelabrum]|nr:lymphotoxin-alpha-like isoform X2 [Corticium candelabrum]XP_062513695.1 lymphotoxin-alpha-like isoform X2 [Corticium candelabrum]
MRGSKGERGIAGIMGRDGDEGMKGDKGENGIVGPRGMKGVSGKIGVRGPPGLEGERGEKGEGGESLRVADIEETITTLIDHKLAALNSTLWSKMEQLSEEIPPQDQSGIGSGTELTEDFEKPAAHLAGNGVGGYYRYGIIIQWYTASGSVWSPFLQGGMKYSNGYITVPQRGLYYVYAQLHYDHRNSSSFSAGFSIRFNGKSRTGAYRYTQDKGDYHTHYTGRIISLNKGDRLSLYFSVYCYCIFNSSTSFFGAFKL